MKPPTLRCVRAGVLSAAVLLCATSVSAQSLSQDPAALFGKWRIETAPGHSSDFERTFEFFPDGNVLETSSYSSRQGGTTQTYRKRWSFEGSAIQILAPGADPANGQSIKIALPFDPSRLAIVETWESPTSTRTTRMFASRVGGPAPTASPAATASVPATPPKIELGVVPSVRTTRDGYFKSERIALRITLRNQSLRAATGPLRVAYWVFGKSDQLSNTFWAFSAGNFSCDLGVDGATRSFTHTSADYVNRFYNPSAVISSSDRFEYSGWVVTVTGPDGRLLLVKASRPQWEQAPEKAARLEANRAYNLSLDVVPQVSPPMRL